MSALAALPSSARSAAVARSGSSRADEDADMNLRVLFCICASHLWLSKAEMARPVVGGFSSRGDHGDPHVQDMASFAVAQLSSTHNQKLELVKIHSLHTQIVAGTNYKFVLDVANEQNEKLTYEATVYEPLGGQQKQLTQQRVLPKSDASSQHASEASSERHSGALLGGFKEVETNSSEVTQAAEFAAAELSQQSNSLLPLQLEEVVKAKSKVEAGIMYELELKLKQEQAAVKLVKVRVSRGIGNHYTMGPHEFLG